MLHLSTWHLSDLFLPTFSVLGDGVSYHSLCFLWLLTPIIVFFHVQTHSLLLQSRCLQPPCFWRLPQYSCPLVPSSPVTIIPNIFTCSFKQYFTTPSLYSHQFTVSSSLDPAHIYLYPNPCVPISCQILSMLFLSSYKSC